MARPNKDSITINIRMEKEIAEKLEEFSKNAGMTKTIVIERAVKEYIEKHKESNDR